MQWWVQQVSATSSILDVLKGPTMARTGRPGLPHSRRPWTFSALSWPGGRKAETARRDTRRHSEGRVGKPGRRPEHLPTRNVMPIISAKRSTMPLAKALIGWKSALRLCCRSARRPAQPERHNPTGRGRASAPPGRSCKCGKLEEAHPVHSTFWAGHGARLGHRPAHASWQATVPPALSLAVSG